MLLNFFLSILSAFLLILCFPKPELAFLAWFALVPWLFAVRRQKPLQAFLLSYLAGLVFFSGTIYWVNYVSGLGFIILVCYLALYFALFGLIFSTFNFPSFAKASEDRQLSIFNFFIIPCLWVALEYIRSHLFTGFGWALLGYSQYSLLPVIQISDITGAYGVSFLLVVVNVGIFYILNRRYKTGVLCSLFAVLLALGYGQFRLSQPAGGEGLKVAVVQGNIPQTVKWNPQARDYILEKYSLLTGLAALQEPEIIIWPETSVPGYLEDEPELLDRIYALSKRVCDAYLLVGTPHLGEKGRLYNSATLFSQGEIEQRYDKLHLVPFGEFMPLSSVFSRFSFANLIGDFSPGKDYTVFSLAKTKSEARFSVLVCFEDIFGHLARRFVQRGASLLVNITNDAWFRDSSEPYQHLQASVFRAVENRVGVVRSANTGVSCFISPWGEILSRVSDESGRDVLVEGERTHSLKIVSMSSFYTAFGDIFAWFCLAASILHFLFRPSVLAGPKQN